MATGKPILTKVTINGTDITSYLLGWNVKKNWEQEVSSAEIILAKNAENVVTLTDSGISQSVTIQRGVDSSTEEYAFQGEILKISPTGSTYIITCKDKLYEAIRKEITYSFDKDVDNEAGVISEIFLTLINDYTSLTATSSTVQSTGSVFVLKKFICNHADIYDRLTELNDTMGWHFFYDPDTDYVYFQPKGYTTSSITLEVGTNIANPPTWEYNAEKLINKITVIGAETEVETTEYFNGDGSEDEFVLSKTPKSVKVWVGSGAFDPSSGTFPHDDNDNLETGGKTGSTSGSFDYEVDEDRKLVDFVSGSEPPSGTNNIEITYSHMLPAPVVLSNPTSISLYGEHRTTVFKVELKTIDDAENFATQQLSKYSLPFVSSKLKVTNTTGLNPGELVRVIDSQNNIDRWLFITEITEAWPYRYDEITVGDELWKTAEWEAETETRVRRLEEEMGKTTDLLLHVVDLNHSAIYERRYTKLMTKEYELTDSIFILGNKNFGVLGTDTLGDNTGRVEKMKKIVPGGMIHSEYIYDNDFTEDGTTATIDTTNNEIQF